MSAWPRRGASVLLWLTVSLAGCGGPSGGAARPPLAPSLEPEALQRAAAWILESQAAPGAIVGVRPRGAGATVAAAGVADLTSGRPIDAEAPFYLGSIAKVYTATLVLQLVEEGRVGLEQPLADFLPGFPGADAIRLRHLLQHSSGLADLAVWAYFRPDWTEMVREVTRQWSRRELVAKAAQLEPDFPPGSDWAYSNTNYILLGVVIEEATGNSLARELRRRIFEPLELESTWLDQYEEPRGRLAATGYMGPLPFWPHSRRFGALGPTTALDRGNLEWGAGGMVSTAEEATRFLEALLGGELLSDESLTAMRDWVETPPLGSPGSETPPDRENGYGLGLARSVRAGYRMIGHGGLYNGHTAGLWSVPECSASIAFYVNRGFVDSRAIMDHLVATLGC